MNVIVAWSHPQICVVCGGSEQVNLATLHFDQRRRPGASSRSIPVPCPHCTDSRALCALIEPHSVAGGVE